MTDVAVSLRTITKRFSRRGRWVLSGIDLQLQPGSKTVIVGGNGSGKSTLLRIGAGVNRPTGGTVTLPKRIGYVPERLAARTKFTGREYLSHMGRIKGLSAVEVDARGRELLQRLGLFPGPDEPIDSLSKGNRQKLVLTQAFLGPVGLLVLDEPFSGLDPVAHTALGELIDEAQADGAAVLVSSHRPFPDEPGLRQLRVQDGQLVEVLHDVARATERVRLVEVVLEPTESAADRLQVAAIAGVSNTSLDESEGQLVLITDSLQSDGVLTKAIVLGWSVRSVRDVPPEAIFP